MTELIGQVCTPGAGLAAAFGFIAGITYDRFLGRKRA